MEFVRVSHKDDPAMYEGALDIGGGVEVRVRARDAEGIHQISIRMEPSAQFWNDYDKVIDHAGPWFSEFQHCIDHSLEEFVKIAQRHGVIMTPETREFIKITKGWGILAISDHVDA